MLQPPPARPLRFQANGVGMPRAAALVAVLAFAAPAIAEERNADVAPSSSWSLGIGVLSRQQPYTGIDRKTMVFPAIQFENRYFSVSGPQVGIKLPRLNIGDSQQLNFSIVGRYDPSGYRAKDARSLKGMSERESGFWAGAEVEWKNDLVDVNAAWRADASGNSKGRIFSLGLERTWQLGRHVMLTPRMEATWHDKKYVNYYFGVRDSEARQGRPTYVGKGGASAELGMRGIYIFQQHHSLFLDVAVSSLAKGVTDSPLVDSSTENRVLLGYSYRFR